MNKIFNWVGKCFFVSFLTGHTASAFNTSGFYGGLGFFSQNAINSTSQKADGSTGFLGEASYPLLLKYDRNISLDWFISPQLVYSPVARKTDGDTAKITTMHLVIPFGKNFSSGAGSPSDWYLGPGLLRYQIDGTGGTTVMSNGTGTATFARPGASATIQKITFVAGASMSFDRSRLSAELILENIFSSKKRAEDLMVSYAYRFGGGF